MLRSQIVLLVIGLSVISCSIFKTDKKGKKAAQNEISIAGNWKTPCIGSDVFGLTRTIREFNISSIGDFDKTESFYKDDACETVQAVYTVSGTYDALGKDAENKGVEDINFTVNNAYLTVSSESMLGVLNGASMCGIADWSTGKKAEITGKSCGGVITAKGDVIFDVYSLRGEKLYFGQKFFFMSEDDADSRPKDVQTDVQYQK